MAIQPKQVPFTRSGFSKLQGKLDSLLTYREEVVVRLQRAREQGDLSENGAYKAARFELSDTDRNIRQTQYLLKYGKAVEPKRDGTIGVGNAVTLQKSDGSQVVYEIVGTYEADPLKGKISLESPLGAELTGKKIGASVTVNTNLYLIKKVN